MGKTEETCFKTVDENGGVDIRPFNYAMNLIGGKWKMQILFWLWKQETMRYGELRRAIEGVSHKMLSSQLDELEQDCLIIRTEYPQVPPKVEYSLSEIGKTLMPVLHEICLWGHEHLNDKKDNPQTVLFRRRRERRIKHKITYF